MSTAAPAPTPIASRQLPMFEGFKVPRARIAFGGALDIALTSPEDIELVQALKLGATLAVTIAIDGHGISKTLDARCVKRSHRFRKEEESESIVSDYRIVINDVRDGDDEGDD
ncbi:MAG: hypothetical protein AB7O78_01535 [Thermoleophilia bacterium]